MVKLVVISGILVYKLFISIEINNGFVFIVKVGYLKFFCNIFCGEYVFSYIICIFVYKIILYNVCYSYMYFFLNLLYY